MPRELVPSDIEGVRRLLPITRELVYFNHAATGPLPTTALDAVNGYARRQAMEGQVPFAGAEAGAEEARTLLSRLMRVPASTIAFTKNTSAGVIIAIGSVEWKPGDNVVLMEDDFPTVTYPFKYLLPQVEKRLVTSEELVGGPDAVFRLVDGRTRMVAVSWVHFLTGRRFDISAICHFCRERGVMTVIDAIQGLGAVDFDWGRTGADFVVSHGAKWMLSPQGTGFMYVNPDTMPRLKPYNLGWLSAEWHEFGDIFSAKPLKAGAARYEEGTKNYLAIFGMKESLALFDRFGMAGIEARVRKLTGLLREGLERAGFVVVTPADAGRSAGIVACHLPGADTESLYGRLNSRKCACSLREKMLRISPHFYNAEEEVGRFLAVLTEGAS